MSRHNPIYYCYVLLDPRYPETRKGEYAYGSKTRFTHKPFYVGKGKGTRSAQHVKEVLAGRMEGNRHKKHTIAKILDGGYEVKIVYVLTEVSSATALSLEEKLITAIGRRDLKQGPLTNLTDGGERETNQRVSQETRRKLRMIHLGRPKSEATKAKLSAARKGAVFTAEHCAKISKAKIGKYGGPKSEATRAKLSAARKGIPLSAHHLAAVREGQQRRRAREAFCKEGFFV